MMVALSASGETEELLRLLPVLKRKGDALIGFCCNLQSTLALASDVALDVSVEREACGRSGWVVIRLKGFRDNFSVRFLQ